MEKLNRDRRIETERGRGRARWRNRRETESEMEKQKRDRERERERKMEKQNRQKARERESEMEKQKRDRERDGETEETQRARWRNRIETGRGRARPVKNIQFNLRSTEPGVQTQRIHYCGICAESWVNSQLSRGVLNSSATQYVSLRDRNTNASLATAQDTPGGRRGGDAEPHAHVTTARASTALR